jgi:hypothetical protein
MVMLDTRMMAELTQNISGMLNRSHCPSACRTTYAEVNPENNITMLNIPT